MSPSNLVRTRVQNNILRFKLKIYFIFCELHTINYTVYKKPLKLISVFEGKLRRIILRYKTCNLSFLDFTARSIKMLYEQITITFVQNNKLLLLPEFRRDQNYI